MSFSTRGNLVRLALGLAWLQGLVFGQSSGLVDFKKGLADQHITAQDARLELISSDAGPALRVETGHAQTWPGVTLAAPGGYWDLSSYATVVVQLRNVDSATITVNCRVDNAGADGTRHCVNGSAAIQPKSQALLRVPLKRYGDGQLDGKLFGMRGYPKTAGGEQTIDASRVTQLLLFLHKPSADHAFVVESVKAEGRFTPPTALTSDADPFFPLIDIFGQYRHRNWPGKIQSLADLALRREQEEKEIMAAPGPGDWDRFGGWQGGPQLKATGYFRTEKFQGKWWLVDPDGRLFWSQGIDCAGAHDATPVEERENWFESFPEWSGPFASFFRSDYVLKGHYAGRTVRCFDFGGANLQRKYGSSWPAATRDLIHRRLRHWGLNTIGNWSDHGLRPAKKTPYVDGLHTSDARPIAGSDGYWGKFADPFDASFRETLRRQMAAKAGQSAGDPWCLGFFSDNEIAWGDDTSLAKAALRSPPDQPAKIVFIKTLEAKYQNIAALNAAWKTAYLSWDAVREARNAPDSQEARVDLEAFYAEVAEAYFRTARAVIKEAAPSQLYLGCRFAWVNARAAAAAARHCDVVSYNLYQRSVADFKFNGEADVPLMIGEFHFGALDRGMFHTGLVPVASQEERAKAYADYVTGALRHPQFVGSHWFQYQDEPTTGRAYDEENYQIGFVDIADTPYPEITAASRAVAANLYQTRLAAGREQAAAPVELASPGGSVTFRLCTDAAGHLAYAVGQGGQTKLELAPAGIVVEGLDYGAAAQIGAAKRREISETFPWRGNKNRATNHCISAEIPIVSDGAAWSLDVRIFDDGAAFRYRVPGTGPRRIAGESTRWRLPSNATAWFQTNTVNYEGVYQSRAAAKLADLAGRGIHFGPPVTLVYEDGSCALISEAALYHYSGLTLRPEADGTLQADFEDDPRGWTHEGEILSPWRLAVLSPDLNGLVNSDVIPALCDAPDPKLFPEGLNTTWIRPGKAPCTWMVYGNDGAQWPRQKWFVDTAAAAGCEYLLVDAGWRSEKWGWMKDGSNVWARTAELCRYAAERNVGIFLWHPYPDGREDSPGLTTIEAREELFRECEKAGVKGVKIDFFDSESKATIEAYEDLLRRSAQHHLMINFHGANKPTGEARTWPHEITREGIREQEYVLWDSLPLEHYGAIPFTRLAAGHGDFLPGYIQERFLKNTTVIFQMGATIAFSSPFLCLPDSPEAYLQSPLLQFIRTVPTTWDETRILPGSAIGECLMIARRKADEWHLAILNCRPEKRRIEVDLRPLLHPDDRLTIYRDGLAKTEFEIAASVRPPATGFLETNLAPGGGCIVQIAPPHALPGWK